MDLNPYWIHCILVLIDFIKFLHSDMLIEWNDRAARTQRIHISVLTNFGLIIDCEVSDLILWSL